MRQRSGPRKVASEKVVKDIRRATRKRHKRPSRATYSYVRYA